MLAGDFSNARLADGRQVTIYDPATTRPNPSGAGFVRDPFPGNIIPAHRIDPVARSVSRLFPSPTLGGRPLGAINYTRTDGNRVDKDSYSFRVDHNFTSSNACSCATPRRYALQSCAGLRTRAKPHRADGRSASHALEQRGGG